MDKYHEDIRNISDQIESQFHGKYHEDVVMYSCLTVIGKIIFAKSLIKYPNSIEKQQDETSKQISDLINILKELINSLEPKVKH